MRKMVFLGVNVSHWTLGELSDLIAQNIVRGEKYELRVGCSFKYNRFYIKFYQGDTLIKDEVTKNTQAHLVIAEMHVKFYEFLNQKDKEYENYFEEEKAVWARRRDLGNED